MSARTLMQRCGAVIALAALMLQFALAFDHVHKRDLGVVGSISADTVSISHARAGLRVERIPVRLTDDDDFCPICFSSFLLSNTSLPVAAVPPHALAFAVVDPPFTSFADRIARPRYAAFLSRGPPAV